MPVAPGLNTTGELTPKQQVGGLNQAAKISQMIGGLVSNKTANTTSETNIAVFEHIPADRFSHSFNFLLKLKGLISSDGSDDATIDLYAVEPDDTATKIATVTTAALANEDDKQFNLEFQGRVLLEQDGATNGKLLAQGDLTAFQGTALQFAGTGASGVAGEALDLRNGIRFEVRAKWDDTDATTDIIATTALGWIHNIPGFE